MEVKCINNPRTQQRNATSEEFIGITDAMVHAFSEARTESGPNFSTAKTPFIKRENYNFRLEHILQYECIDLFIDCRCRKATTVCDIQLSEDQTVVDKVPTTTDCCRVDRACCRLVPLLQSPQALKLGVYI